ncbi:MAG: glycosyltransferase family 2 protein [Deltaproteobacteria bacterium]|nr:glycosyltransferase family 2 protein [Deltaproteobacteria bacterium]
MELATVIIVSWNGRHLLPDCLNSLQAQEFKKFETIVVDNGSSDGSVEWVHRHHPEVRVVPLSSNQGFCAANNIGYRLINTKYVALLNNDAVAHPLWLESLVDALEKNNQAGFAASKILHYEKPDTIDRAGDSYTRAGVGLLRGRGMSFHTYEKPEWIFGACAAAALYRKGMIDEIGFFDEDFFLLHEDVDLSFRAQLKGYRCLYVPAAEVYHKTSSSIVRDSNISIYYGHRNMEWVYLQNMPGRLLGRTIVLHLAHMVGSFIYFSCRGQIRNILRAKWDAFRHIKAVLQKRRRIQKGKRVEDVYIWNLLESEHFLTRYMTHVQRNQTRNRKESL